MKLKFCINKLNLLNLLDKIREEIRKEESTVTKKQSKKPTGVSKTTIKSSVDVDERTGLRIK
jgi:hypothetical protein